MCVNVGDHLQDLPPHNDALIIPPVIPKFSMQNKNIIFFCMVLFFVCVAIRKKYFQKHKMKVGKVLVLLPLAKKKKKRLIKDECAHESIGGD